MFFLVFTVFNLANNIDVEETKRMIEQYRKENKDQISKGKTKLVCFTGEFIKTGMFYWRIYQNWYVLTENLSKIIWVLVDFIKTGYLTVELIKSGTFFQGINQDWYI